MNTIQRLRNTVIITLTALGMLVSAASAASAHDELIGSAPAASESLASSPEAIVLEFNNTILNTGSVILVTNVNGESVTTGELTVTDRTVTQPLITDLPNGQYRVVWRVVSADGHPIEDAYQFAVGEPIGPFEPTETPTPTPAETQEATPEDPAEAVPVMAVSEDSDSTPLRVALIALIGAAAGVGIYALVAAQRKRSTKNTLEHTKEDSTQ